PDTKSVEAETNILAGEGVTATNMARWGLPVPSAANYRTKINHASQEAKLRSKAAKMEKAAQLHIERFKTEAKESGMTESDFDQLQLEIDRVMTGLPEARVALYERLGDADIKKPELALKYECVTNPGKFYAPWATVFCASKGPT